MEREIGTGTAPGMAGAVAPGMKPVARLVAGLCLVLVFVMALPVAVMAGLAPQQINGCLVCHGDPKLVKIEKGKKPRSLYVDPKEIAGSVHKDVACSDCHLNFGFRQHAGVRGDSLKIAKFACGKCHTHKKQDEEYVKGAHGSVKKTAAEQKARPGCGDCHGSHDIGYISKPGPYRLKFQRSAKLVCGKAGCHLKDWNSYNDYYHGAAYKEGAVDSPTCWDCHDYHAIYPKEDARSWIAPKVASKTCGRCHESSGGASLTYGKLIHGTVKVGILDSAERALGPVFKLLVRWLNAGKNSMVSVMKMFFPQSLRPKATADKTKK